jgi:hypothetical protein
LYRYNAGLTLSAMGDCAERLTGSNAHELRAIEAGGGLYTPNAVVDPELESAWFQPLRP